METLYRKVAVEESLPENNGFYDTNLGLLKFYYGKWTCTNLKQSFPSIFYEEVPDPTAQLKADKKALENRVRILKNLNEKYRKELGKDETPMDLDLIVDFPGNKESLLKQNEELKQALENLKNKIIDSSIEAKNSAEMFDKREMEVSHYCSKAMETAYIISANKIEELLNKEK